MKLSIQHLARTMSAFALLFIVLISNVNAISPRASDYFNWVAVNAAAVGNGKVTVEIDITTHGIMKEVGATKIVIYKETSSGSDTVVKTYTRYNTSGLIVKNNNRAFVDVTYSGISGIKYYAVIDVYAKDSDGSETLTYTTNTVIA